MKEPSATLEKDLAVGAPAVPAHETDVVPGRADGRRFGEDLFLAEDEVAVGHG